MKISKKRVVLFLLFIFPLICFLLLSTGQNNFTKLPVVTKNILDISSIDSTKTFKNNISIVCFLGENIEKSKAGLFNLNEKVYKKFIDYKEERCLCGKKLRYRTEKQRKFVEKSHSTSNRHRKIFGWYN